MYVPPHFDENRVPVLHAAIREIGFGTLVTVGAAGIIASHIPMLLDPAPAPYGTLVGHLSRANPQWRAVTTEIEALAMFLGPQAYVTPSWYPTKQETGKVVPTWNYVAIHAYGPLRFIEDADWKRAHVTKLTETHEANRPEPWAVSDAPPDFIEGMIKGIVGLEMPITRLEGKWKMNQNRSVADRAGVAEGLVRDGHGDASAVAAIMAARSTPKS
jgi:transcriptional regulator